MEEQPQVLSQSKEQSFFSLFQHPGSILVPSISSELNIFFQGGLQKGTITQLYGEAGSGKTQLAMMFILGCLTRRIPVCFLATEKELSWTRLASLGYNFMNQSEFEENQKFLLYKKSSDFNQGYSFLQESMKHIKEGKKGGLLVIDSIHCFVMNYLENNLIENDPFQKSKKQAEIVNRIRQLAKIAGTAVLLINHAADVIDKRRGSTGRTVVPALGQAWELNIDENLYLTKKNDLRQLIVINSPRCPLNKQKFRIEETGFTWISEDGVQFIQ